MYELLHNLTVTSLDGRTVKGKDRMSLLRTIQGVGNRYGKIRVAEAGLEVVKRSGSEGA